MAVVARSLERQQQLLLATVVGAAWVFWRGTADVFNTVKFTWVVWGTITLLAATSVHAARTRRLLLPPAWVLGPLGVFSALTVAAALWSATPLRSFVGEVGRHTGTAAYLTYALVLVAAARVAADRGAEGLLWAVALGAVPVAVYALVQAAGLGPFDWQAVEGGPQVVASFGNADFLSAWLGASVPAAVWLALRSRGGWRWAGLAAAVLATVAAAATASLQGPVVAGVGAGLVVLVWLWTAPGWETRRVPLTVAAAVAAVAVVGVVVSGVGPLGPVRASAAQSLETRVGKWEAAVAMVADRPWTGVGMGAYGDYFHRYRSPALAIESGLRRTVDDPHNVPLAMATSGGVGLLAAWLAVVAATAAAGWRALRRSVGAERSAVAAVAGVWLAYLLQAQVSIDVPPLAVLGWAAAGTLVGSAVRSGDRPVEVRLGGAPARRRGRRRRPAPTIRPAPPAWVGATAVGWAALVVVASWPLRADAVAGGARDLEGVDPRAAAVRYLDAGAIATWEGEYPAQAARVLAALGDIGAALEAEREAARREPRDLAHTINVARLLVAAGRADEARSWYERALVLDPHTPEVLGEVGRFELDHGDPQRAVALLEQVVAVRSEDASWWAALGRAQAAVGDTAAARVALERALALDPDLEEARQALDALG